jgi:urease accessory protein
MLDAPKTQTMQRARGRAHLAFRTKGGKTKLTDLHQSGCVKALLPKNHADRIDAVLINTAGGVTGGDRLNYSAQLDAGAELCLTTQTAERIYKSSSDIGKIETQFTLGPKTALDWLPQETILFDHSALSRTLTIDMDNSASALILEPIVLGRKAMGETLNTCHFTDQWRINRGGKLAYADALRITDPTALSGAACLGHNRAFATLVYVAPDAEQRRDQMRALINFDDVTAATSAWNGCLVTRFIAPDAQPLRRALIATLTEFRAHPLPRVWHM